MINSNSVIQPASRIEAKNRLKTPISLSNSQHRKLASFDELSKIGCKPISINSSRLKDGSVDPRNFTPIKRY